MKVRGHLKELDADGRTKLKMNIKKLVKKAWTECVHLKTGTRSVVL